MLMLLIRPLSMLLLLVAGGCLTGRQVAAAERALRPLQYSVSFADADRHRVDVELLVPVDAGAKQLELAMAVWTPGSYLVREYARHIEQISATDVETAESLQIRKTSKNRWSVQTSGASTVRVRYRLYCREMSVRTNWVERDFGVLVGAATYLTRADDLRQRRARPHHVQFVLPGNWQQAVMELPTDPAEPQRFLAASYDALVDAPTVLGNPQISSFIVGEKPHRLVTLGGDGLWDNEAAARDVAKIVEQHQQFWQSVPYESYTFLNVISETRGGLEHDNCCLMMTSRWAYRDAKQYRNWLGLVSHEFFHTWNVRRLRPAGLETYDYERENYTDGLWVAEGVTSYYDDLLQRRAGLLTDKQYLEGVSKVIDGVQKSGGRLVQPLLDSSHDAWIKYYRPDENARNSRISYYSKGSLVAWLLDARVRQATNHQQSLDDVMRSLYQRHAGRDQGFTLADFLQVVTETADAATADWLQQTVGEAQELDYEPAMACWGLAWNDKTQDQPPAADAEDSTETASTTASPESASSRELTFTPDLGMEVATSGGQVMIESVDRLGPADQAGWNAGDELIAIEGFRMTGTTYPSRLKQMPIGKPLRALLSRRGALIERPVTLPSEPSRQWKLSVRKVTKDAADKPDAEDAKASQRRQLWLGS